MLVADLQSWARCAGCLVVIWVGPSAHEQRCGCRCGGLALHDGDIVGLADPMLTAEDMQAELDA